ncbi:MAG: hypothetical protein Q9170_000307 [Blastenia crenularia]
MGELATAPVIGPSAALAPQHHGGMDDSSERERERERENLSNASFSPNHSPTSGTEAEETWKFDE